MKIQGMYLNGPMGGRIIELPDPPPAKLTVAVNLNRCIHGDPEQGFPITMLQYSVNKPLSPLAPYAITLDSDFDDTGWYCPTCRAEAEVRYKLNKIREILREEDDDDEDEEY
jgi:hypothetical protein